MFACTIQLEYFRILYTTGIFPMELFSVYDLITTPTWLPTYLNILNKWLQKWEVRVNEAKNKTHITFTVNHITCSLSSIEHKRTPDASEMKYFGLYFHRDLVWKTSKTRKRKDMGILIVFIGFLPRCRPSLRKHTFPVQNYDPSHVVLWPRNLRLRHRTLQN